VTEQSPNALLVRAGGAGLHSLVQHGGASHLGTCYRIAGPLIARILLMGGTTPRKVAADLLSPSEQGNGGGWASHLPEAHKMAVDLQESFSNGDMQMAFHLDPRGLVIFLPCDPRSVSKEQAPTVDTDVIPPGRLPPGSTRGVKHVAAGIRRLSDYRRFLDILGASPDQVRTKLLTHSGHGRVSVLHTNTPMPTMCRRRQRASRSAELPERRPLGTSSAGLLQPFACGTQGGTQRSH